MKGKTERLLDIKATLKYCILYSTVLSSIPSKQTSWKTEAFPGNEDKLYIKINKWGFTILDHKNLLFSALQLTQTVPIEMKTRILHANEAKSTGIIVSFLGSKDLLIQIKMVYFV